MPHGNWHDSCTCCLPYPTTSAVSKSALGFGQYLQPLRVRCCTSGNQEHRVCLANMNGVTTYMSLTFIPSFEQGSPWRSHCLFCSAAYPPPLGDEGAADVHGLLDALMGADWRWLVACAGTRSMMSRSLQIPQGSISVSGKTLFSCRCVRSSCAESDCPVPVTPSPRPSESALHVREPKEAQLHQMRFRGCLEHLQKCYVGWGRGKLVVSRGVRGRSFKRNKRCPTCVDMHQSMLVLYKHEQARVYVVSVDLVNDGWGAGLQFAPHLSKSSIGYEHEVKDLLLSGVYDIASEKPYIGVSKVCTDSDVCPMG